MSAGTLERHATLYADTTKSLDELVHLEDPAFYVDPWPVYARLQAEAPAYFYRRLNTWVVTRHHDVRYVARTPEIFTASHGILLLDGVKSGAGAQDLFAGAEDFVGLTDPPRHTELRRIMQPPFMPPALAALEPRIAGFVDDLLTNMPLAEPVDWVERFAARLPVMVIAAILGIDDHDEEFFGRVRAWSDIVEDLASKDLSEEELVDGKRTFTELNSYILAMFDRKRRAPGDDFLSSLLADELDGRKLSEANLVGCTQALIAAGSDTVRSMLSSIVALFAAHDDQFQIVREDASRTPAAVEEILRFAPPARAFARQVVTPTVLHGQQLSPGERMVMAFDAANRDPEVFDDPHVFDVTKDRAHRNVAFGFGTHVCIAAPLARIEGRVVIDALRARCRRFEPAGEGRRVESFLRNGWHDLPVVLYAR
jgi:cytochrome P450